MGALTVRGLPLLRLPSVGASLFWLPLPRPLLPLVFTEALAGDSFTGLGSFLDPLPRPRPLVVDALSEAPLLVADCFPPRDPLADCFPRLETVFSISGSSSIVPITVCDLTVLADCFPRLYGEGFKIGCSSSDSESSSSEICLPSEPDSGTFSSSTIGMATGDGEPSFSSALASGAD